MKKVYKNYLIAGTFCISLVLLVYVATLGQITEVTNDSAEQAAGQAVQSGNIPPKRNQSVTEESSKTRPTQAGLSIPRPSSSNQVNQDYALRVEERQTEKVYYALGAPNDSNYNSTPFTIINAEDAWDITTGSSAVKVAVLDSGFALDHEDLQQQWSVNQAESGNGKESDGIDNDDNGYIDDHLGWDFSSIDNSPQAGQVNPSGDGVSHGTQVSGLIGATGNNGLGSTGVSWNVSLLPLQVLSDDGSGYSGDIVDAIYYAVDQGVDVINMSLGTSGDDPAVREAVDYAISNNVVVVAAAGNCGNNFVGSCQNQVPGYVTFPASYNKVISVGAVDNNQYRAGFSSYGQRVDIVAPGSGTLVSPTWDPTNQTSAYSNNLYGTSFSSPIVAGSAALIRSIDTFAPEEVKALLLAASRKTSNTGSIYSPQYGHGILDIGQSSAIAKAFSDSASTQEPILVLAGGIRPEHDVSTQNVTSVGCQIEVATWCTVLLQNDASHYDRYLPYQLTDSSGLSDWKWTGGLLTNGQWQLSARQNSRYSPADFFEVQN